MLPFSFTKAADEDSALAAGASGARYIAGGTTLVDLMRETVERPEAVVDINALPYRDIELGPNRQLTIHFPDGTIHNTGPPKRTAA